MQPVYVLSPAEFNLSIEFTPPWIEQYRPSAETALSKLLQQLNLPNAQRPEILVQNTASIRNAVEHLCRYAESENADAILVSTHGRGGIPRILLGSFAETLILHSKTPVLVTGPKTETPNQLKSFFLPTDLGPGSRRIFQRTVSMARQMGASLTLFHSIPNPVEPFFQSGISLLGGGWVPLQNLFTEEAERRRRCVQMWCRWARRRGVPTEPIISEIGGNVASQIIENANRMRSDVIVMAAQSGPVVTALVGSITRQVVRHASRPVWILHPPRNP